MGNEFISAETTFPAPMVTETERQQRLEKHRLSIWANGCVIEKEWRVHNPVFDGKGEKTTTKFRVRPAKDKGEFEFIASRLRGFKQE